MRKTILGLFLCLASGLAAQETQTLYQLVEVNDSVEVIQLNAFSEVETEIWASNVIMVEWRVELFGAPKAVLNFLVSQERYRLDTVANSQILNLVQPEERFQPIETRTGTLTELIRIKVFIPQEFAAADANRWLRKESEIKEDH